MSDPLRPPSSSETLEMRPTTTSAVGIDDVAADIEDDEPKGSNSDRRALRVLVVVCVSSLTQGSVLYVIILSAALDLVPPSTPKGIIAFCNIAPALIVKVGWPVLGMIVVAFSDALSMRLLGISLASFSSGLGELTFLQLSTTYAPPSIAGHSVGYFASGTGAAGLVGAFLWWELRSLGVRVGVGLSSVLPFVIPLTFYFLLPPNSAFLPSSSYDDDDSSYPITSTLPYTPLPTDDDVAEEEGSVPAGPKRVFLSPNDKLQLVKPLLMKYMLPLFCVYLFEYTINQGIAPTLLYPVPSPDKYSFLSKFIHSVRDYYPLWQLVYQTTVFFSRSSISMGLPPLPARLLSLPSIVQCLILLSLAYESAVGFYSDDSEGLSIITVFLLVSLEGICGGLAYVNVFYRVNQEHPDPNAANDVERTRQEREFKIGSIGFADSSGILLASLVAVPTEVRLCRAQVRRGKLLCQGL
ncbi:batten's disease protein Cln3 [Armillaria borealis]|uniref:Protein BTN n=1 Tax=Armillaria borealis TaxID=47425 RepID=A0AA39K446_9AGAR|nr:batten's disease protein Cln3 [Armillaria borealis]